MFEAIGAIAYTALYAALVAVLVGFSPARRSTKLAVAAAAAVWGVIVVTIAGFASLLPALPVRSPFPWWRLPYSLPFCSARGVHARNFGTRCSPCHFRHSSP